MLPIQLPAYFFLQLIIFQVYSSSLDCNFDSESCCWKNEGDGTPWQIYHGKSRDDENRTIIHSRLFKNQTSRYFLAASVTPQQKFSASWISCPLCSETGLVTVRLRAHQTSTSRIKLCWKPVDDEETVYRHCTFLRTWRSFEPTNKHFTTVPKQYHQFYIKLYNHGRSSVAAAIIDNIAVITEECELPIERPKAKSPRLYSVARVAGKQKYTKDIIQHTTSKPTPALPTTEPISNSSFILKDIFGDAFAQFLVDDDDGLINENEKIELPNEINKDNNGKLQAAELNGAFTTTARSLFNFNILECNASGGCLFDRSMCSYQNSYLSRGSTFQRVNIYGRNFMQALTVPNTIAVMEVNTIFTEEYKIVFDVLEFTEGERLYGCCYKRESHEPLFTIMTIFGGNRPSELFCPFATAGHPTPVTWRTARFNCPRGTNKILFMCENYGIMNGTCALDSVRVHKILDVLEVEPCQKEAVITS